MLYKFYFFEKIQNISRETFYYLQKEFLFTIKNTKWLVLEKCIHDEIMKERDHSPALSGVQK